MKRRFADSPVKLWSMGSAFDYHTPDQAKLRRDIEDTKKYIVLSHDVGSTGVKVRPNALPKGVPPEKTLEQIGRSLRELGDFARDHGQQIRLEIHGAETSLVPNAKRILDVADHPLVGACWNSNATDLAGAASANFDLVKIKSSPCICRICTTRITRFGNCSTAQGSATGFCFAEIPEAPTRSG